MRKLIIIIIIIIIYSSYIPLNPQEKNLANNFIMYKGVPTGSFSKHRKNNKISRFKIHHPLPTFS